MIRRLVRKLRKHRPRIAITVPARLAIGATAVYGIWQGAWILLSGPERWSGPSYAVLRELPASPPIWGIWAFVAGIMIAFGLTLPRWEYHWRLRAAGLLALSIWAAAFSIGTLLAAYELPTAGSTGGPTYLFCSLVMAILIGYDDPEEQP